MNVSIISFVVALIVITFLVVLLMKQKLSRRAKNIGFRIKKTK